MDLTFDDTFDISNYGGKLFKAEPLKLSYEISAPGLEPATPEGAEIQKLVKVAWTAEIAKWKKAKEAEYKKILALTEEAVRGSAARKAPEFHKAANGDNAKATELLVKWLGEEAKGANVMIKNALTTFQGMVQARMTELWTKLAAAVDKKYKTKILNTQVKAVLKIIGLSILIVAAAALTIAGAVLAALAAPTGVGAIAGIGLAVGGIATVIGAVAKIYDVYNSTWPDHKKAASSLAKNLEVLKDALIYEDKKLEKTSQGAKLGPKERLKLLLGNVKGKKTAVEADIKKLHMWTASMMQDIEKGAQKEIEMDARLQELEKAILVETNAKQLAQYKATHAAGVKKIFEMRLASTGARGYLKRYAAIAEEAGAVMASEDRLTGAAVGTLLGKLETLATSKEMDTLITVGKGGVEFFKGLMKILK